MMGQRPRAAEGPVTFSVIVPAHDEEHLIGRCLSFLAKLAPGEAEVVVVANGCSDRTAAVARAAGAQVVELTAAGKVGALNAGDAAVSAFPRIYLDADIAVEVDTLRRLVEALADDPPAVAAPRPLFVTEGRPLLVRLFYRAWERLPYIAQDMVGSGMYAVNEAGRARFGTFPEFTGDDLFVQRRFVAAEIRILSNTTFAVQTPWDLRSLLAVRTRVAYGNNQLAATGERALRRSTGTTLPALGLLSLRSPRLAPACVVYAAVTAVSRVTARRRSAAAGWQRDATTRDAARSGEPITPPPTIPT